MIVFELVKKSDATKKCTVKVDMVDGSVENCTVMTVDNVKGTEFEKVLPWHQGSVTSMTEIKQWAEANVTDYTMYQYEGDKEAVVVAEEPEEEEETEDGDEE